MLMYSLENQF